jgi:5'-nucleotidase / UDP-sugar diphosphatase
LNAGNNLFAGVEFNASLEKGIPFYETIAMESIGYDVSTFGNHDFDFGPDVVAEFISGFHSLPFVAANLDFHNESSLNALVSHGRLARSIVLNVKGEKVGVIGAVTPQLAVQSSPRNVLIDADLVQSIQSEISTLQSNGVKIIILLTHIGGLQEDQDLIASLHGVDVVVSAASENTNELQANPEDLLIPGDVAFAAYPLIAHDLNNTPVAVVSTTGNYRYIGQLTAGFDRNGNLIEINEQKSHPFRVAGGSQPDALQADPKLQKKVVQPVQAAVESLASNVIANSEVNLNGVEGDLRTIETNEGNLVADSMLSEAARLAPSFGTPVPNVAIMNGGAIRNDNVIPAGEITELDTFEIAPFPNFVSIVPNIPAVQLKEILENAVSQVNVLDGRFAQVSGISFTWDPNGTAQVLDSNGNVTTPGTRIREVSLKNGTVLISGGAVVSGAPSVTIAVTTFLATSGDQYPFRGAAFTNLGITYQQALFNYLVNTLNGQITAAAYPESGEARITKL